MFAACTPPLHVCSHKQCMACRPCSAGRQCCTMHPYWHCSRPGSPSPASCLQLSPSLSSRWLSVRISLRQSLASAELSDCSTRASRLFSNTCGPLGPCSGSYGHLCCCQRGRTCTAGAAPPVQGLHWCLARQAVQLACRRFACLTALGAWYLLQNQNAHTRAQARPNPPDTTTPTPSPHTSTWGSSRAGCPTRTIGMRPSWRASRSTRLSTATLEAAQASTRLERQREGGGVGWGGGCQAASRARGGFGWGSRWAGGWTGSSCACAMASSLGAAAGCNSAKVPATGARQTAADGGSWRGLR